MVDWGVRRGWTRAHELFDLVEDAVEGTPEVFLLTLGKDTSGIVELVVEASENG